jgi:hypothetical protein
MKLQKYIDERLLHLRATNSVDGTLNESRIDELERLVDMMKHSKGAKPQQKDRRSDVGWAVDSLVGAVRKLGI